MTNLQPDMPILRVFHARANKGCEEALARKFATSSVAVVDGQPGNLGYVAGSPAHAGGRDFMFCSIWQSREALVARFGASWDASFLPEGYAELIESHSVEHYAVLESALRTGSD